MIKNIERIPLKKEHTASVLEEHKAIKDNVKWLVEYWLEQDRELLGISALEVRQAIEVTKIPRETVPDGFKHVFDKIGKGVSVELGADVVKTLIDIIRNLDDPELRVNLTALMAYDLMPSRHQQLADEYLDSKKTPEKSEEARSSIESLMTREAVFEYLANDEEVQPVYRAWAKHLLNPTEQAQKFLAQFSVEDLLDPGIITTEFRKLPLSGESQLGEPGELVFSGRRVRLPLNWMPDPAKVKEYYRRTKMLLEPSLAYDKGGERHYTDFPQSMVRRMLQIGYRFKFGRITAREREAQLETIMLEFIESMSPKKQQEMEGAIGIGLELRFSTERNKREVDEVIKVIEEEDESAVKEYNEAREAREKLEKRIKGYEAEVA